VIPFGLTRTVLAHCGQARTTNRRGKKVPPSQRWPGQEPPPPQAGQEGPSTDVTPTIHSFCMRHQVIRCTRQQTYHAPTKD
jgi:hypothetical protein